MISQQQLELFSSIPVKDTDPSTLPDILDIEITGDTPTQRFESYLSQIKNPYCFRVGKTPVHISFSSEGNSLEEKLKAHFLSLKSEGLR